MAVSRRSVLSTAGLVGGVTALQSALAPMVAADTPDFTPLSGSRGRGKKVVVIGGGIAGVESALTLARGLPGDTPALLAEAVSTADEKLLRATVAELAAQLVGEITDKPALILYGPLAEMGVGYD